MFHCAPCSLLYTLVCFLTGMDYASTIRRVHIMIVSEFNALSISWKLSTNCKKDQGADAKK